MNVGFWSCLVMAPLFALLALLFAIGKEKTAGLITGFNGLPKAEQALYDKMRMAKDMRNSCALWSAIMLVGAAVSYAVSGYVAIFAYLIWLALFFKDVGFDTRKAFQKYRKEA